ncbi:MAG: PAS domain-containing protein [Alphaproteobacteria bacterium]|nr:PAS domain-containing protein [Alphaproteobacteria bacterium]
MQLMDIIRTDQCRALATAWQRWRGDDLLPRRADMRIAEITPLLPGITVLELRSTEEIVFRLAGTKIAEIMGIELTGRNYVDFAAPPDRKGRAERAMWQGRQPCGAIFLLPIPYSSGRVVVSEVLSLPTLPNKPGEPMQLLAINWPLDDTPRHLSPADPNGFNKSADFRFVDIGAGTPDAALQLSDLPPALLPRPNSAVRQPTG